MIVSPASCGPSPPTRRPRPGQQGACPGGGRDGGGSGGGIFVQGGSVTLLSSAILSANGGLGDGQGMFQGAGGGGGGGSVFIQTSGVYSGSLTRSASPARATAWRVRCSSSVRSPDRERRDAGDGLDGRARLHPPVEAIGRDQGLTPRSPGGAAPQPSLSRRVR